MNIIADTDGVGPIVSAQVIAIAWNEFQAPPLIVYIKHFLLC